MDYDLGKCSWEHCPVCAQFQEDEKVYIPEGKSVMVQTSWGAREALRVTEFNDGKVFITDTGDVPNQYKAAPDPPEPDEEAPFGRKSNEERTEYDDDATLRAVAKILQVLDDEIEDRLGGMDDRYRQEAKIAAVEFVKGYLMRDWNCETRREYGPLKV